MDDRGTRMSNSTWFVYSKELVYIRLGEIVEIVQPVNNSDHDKAYPWIVRFKTHERRYSNAVVQELLKVLY